MIKLAHIYVTGRYRNRALTTQVRYSVMQYVWKINRKTSIRMNFK